MPEDKAKSKLDSRDYAETYRSQSLFELRKTLANISLSEHNNMLGSVSSQQKLFALVQVLLDRLLMQEEEIERLKARI